MSFVIPKEKRMKIRQIREAIENLIDYSRHQSLKELNAIKHIGIDEDKKTVILIITIGAKGGVAEQSLRKELAKVIKLQLGYRGIKIQLEEERRIINSKTKFILVASGKGGVGKSMVSINLALALRRLQKKVALIDADIYCGTIPKMLEMEIIPPEITEQGRIIPFKKDGIEVIATEFFSEPGKAILWRGNLLKSMLSNFFFQVEWNPQLEYVIIDMPAGTGDIMSDISEMIPRALVLLVTTPHIIATDITIKTGNGYRELHHEIIGLVENMAYLQINELNEEMYLCGKGGGLYVADELGIELLATIPIAKPKKHLMIFEEDEEVGQIFNDLAQFILLQ